MYKKFLPALFLLGSSTTFAQSPTLTISNVGPALNDTFVTIVCDTTGITQGPAGNQTWTFTSLIPSTVISPYYDTGSVAAFVSTDPGYSALMLEATVAGSTAAFLASTYAVVTPSGNGTTYNQSTSAKISQTGVYVNSGNFAVYTDPMDQLHFPFSFGNTYTDTYTGGLVYTPSGSPVTATETGTVTVTYDGYGTLVLPAPTGTLLNVARIHSIQNFKDSAQLFGGPVNEIFTLETYTWYMPGYHGPILTISTATNISLGFSSKAVSYAYKQIANHEAVAAITGLDASANVYPNPASNFIYIRYNNATNQKVHTSLIDMLGREVAVISDQATQGITNVSYNVSSLSKGLYLVRLQSANETVTRKIEIQ